MALRKTTLTAAFAGLFAVVLPLSAQPIESSRVQALHEEVNQGKPEAVESFWQDISAKGGPLIERIDEHRGYSLVTFIWRGEPNTKQVFVDGQLGQLTGTRRAENAMTQLPGTSLWYRSYWLRNDLRTLYRFVVVTAGSADGRQTYHADPFGKPWQPAPAPEQSAVPTSQRFERSILELPNAPPQPWVARRPDVPNGRLEQRTWRSKLLKNERDIWVYTPAGYRAAGERPHLLVTTDGAGYVGAIQATSTLDNLIAAKRIPPVVAVFIGNAPIVPGTGRLPRSIELSCNVDFVEFLAREILPWVRSNFHVTTSASQTVIAGSSLGGLNAAFAGLVRPDLFGNVLSQSGAFWWRPPGESESEWLTRQFAGKPRVNVKFYLDSGLPEGESSDGGPLDWLNMADQPIPYGPSILLANRHLRDILKSKGYQVHYAEFNGGHSALSWRASLADGLTALIGRRSH